MITYLLIPHTVTAIFTVIGIILCVAMSATCAGDWSIAKRSDYPEGAKRYAKESLWWRNWAIVIATGGLALVAIIAVSKLIDAWYEMGKDAK